MKGFNHLFVFGILALICLYRFLFINISVGEGMFGRLDQALLILLVGIFIVTFGRIFLLKKVDFLVSLTNRSILLFFVLYFFSGMWFYNKTGNIDRVLSYLPTILFVYSSFGVFYFFSLKGYITNFSRYFFLACSCLLSFYNFLIIFFNKSAVLDGEFYKQSNNAGYAFVILMPLIWYFLKDKKVLNLILMTLSFVFILFSVKRGAIVVGGIIYFYYLYNYMKSGKNVLSKILNTFIILISSGVLLYSLNAYSDELLYRFQSNNSSGRDIIYESILESFLQGNIFELIFGKGFFSTLDVTGNIFGKEYAQMAHNDYLEIGHDLGFSGLSVYLSILLFIFLMFYKNRKTTYSIFLISIFMLIFIKSLISGTFMDKNMVLIFSLLGIIMGDLHRQKRYEIKS